MLDKDCLVDFLVVVMAGSKELIVSASLQSSQNRQLDSSNVVLKVEDLHKSFGVLKATNGVNLELFEGEIHALIGPNGAGKSTLIAQLCGELKPDSGRIYVDGRDVTHQATHQRIKAGMSRSFQITELCNQYSVLENIILSLMLESGSGFSWHNPFKDKELLSKAHQWLAEVSLEHQAQTLVSELAHGEKRQLELAVALARSPRILLLDEPMAGMGSEETQRMTAFLKALKGKYSILLVEHDMDAVFTLADRITVLVYGENVFTGTPESVRHSKRVREAYLGEL